MIKKKSIWVIPHPEHSDWFLWMDWGAIIPEFKWGVLGSHTRFTKEKAKSILYDYFIRDPQTFLDLGLKPIKLKKYNRIIAVNQWCKDIGSGHNA